MTRKTRKEFQLLAELRAKEAGILAHHGEEQGAYYLGGYSIECALKACIAKQTRRHEFPPDRKYVDSVYSQNLTELLRLAGLEQRFETDRIKNSALETNWRVVKNWNESSRYETSGLKGMDMYSAITGPNGVLPWIKQHW